MQKKNILLTVIFSSLCMTSVVSAGPSSSQIAACKGMNSQSVPAFAYEFTMQNYPGGEYAQALNECQRQVAGLTAAEGWGCLFDGISNTLVICEPKSLANTPPPFANYPIGSAMGRKDLDLQKRSLK